MKLHRKLLILLILVLSTTFIYAAKATPVEVVKVYQNYIPESVNTDIKYKGEDLPKLLNYIFVKTKYGNVRQSPSGKSQLIYQIGFNQKLRVIKEVKYKNSKTSWYQVETPNGIGYISSIYCEDRTFRFEKMVSRIHELEKFINDNNMANLKVRSTNSYKPNPFNTGLLKAKDKYGTSLDQNIIGKYYGENIHVPDRSIVSVLSENNKEAKIRVEGIKEFPLTIEKKYLTDRPNIAKGFKKVIAIDIENQNLGAFEKIDGQWTLISYIYAKTGIDSELGFETPKGSFIVPALKYDMGYRGNFGEDLGEARYAIRFSGGGYLHGTPIEHTENANREFFLHLKETGLGTFKGTRKCIRNTESHAKFLFEWVLGNNKNIKSNYQNLNENVVFIIF